MKLHEILNEGRADAPFTCLQVLQNILGSEHVSTNIKTIKPNQFLVQNVSQDFAQYVSPKDRQAQPHVFRGGEVRPHTASAFSRRTAADNQPNPRFKDEDWYTPPTPHLGVISVPFQSREAAAIATTAHEAYHAWLWAKSNSQGQVFANEKMVNQLAVKWLRKNLTGMVLHAAMEAIVHSKISYGHNCITGGALLTWCKF